MKKLFCLLCAAALLLGCFPAAASAYREGATISNAINVTLGTGYTCYWTKDSDMLNCYNRVSIPQNGLLVFRGEKPYDSEGELGSINITIYDQSGEVVWSHRASDAKDDGKDYYQYTVGLAAGTYIVNLMPGFSVYSGVIDFSYRFSFIASNYCEIERNESPRNALRMQFGIAYYGCFGTRGDFNDNDYYQIDFTAGRTYQLIMDDDGLDPTTAMLLIYPPSGGDKLIRFDDTFDAYGNGVEYYTATETGTYTLKLYNYSGEPIPYVLGVTEQGGKLNMSTLPTLPAKEIVRASNPAEGRAGTMLSNAISINFDQSYRGYWSKTSDHLNYYNRVVLPSQGELTITADKPYDSDGKIGYIKFYIYDQYGNQMWNHRSSDAENDGRSYYQYTVGLAAGTYYVNMQPGFSVRSGVIDFNYSMSFRENRYCEIEPNNAFKTATPLVFGRTFSGYFGTRGASERDFYSFPVQQGGEYRISIDDEKLEPKTAMLILYGVEGTDKYLSFNSKNFDEEYNACYNYTATMSGKCYLKLYNYSGEPLKYSIKVTMISGNCAHSWDNGVVTKAATCGSEGVVTYTCTACGATRTGSIPVTGNHTWDEGQVVKPATCKEKGYKSFHCVVCGVEGGLELDRLTEHTWDNGVVTRTATTVKGGVITYTCTACGEKKTETTPKVITPAKQIPGDVDANGSVSSADARLALRASVNLVDYPSGCYEFRVADVNHNGAIDPGDARLILRASVGLETLD